MAAPSPSQQRTNASNSPSSDADATATATAVTVAKKPQPIPWTHEETVNLIRAYQEKWYSLKRGQLKASQWEEVAVTIAVRCRTSPFSAGFSKTGTQCRHKIEKLRKRYRAEKQRPNPAAWPYFDLMDQMERGPLPISVALPVATLNRQHDFDDEDEDFENGDDKQDEDYGHQAIKKRRFEPRVSTDRRLDEFGHIADGSLKNGRKLGNFEHGDPRLRFYSNPSSTNSRFQKRNAPPYAAAVEPEEEEEVGEEEDVGGSKESKDMMGELAVQMREFSERFMRMERKKMEAMRETQRYRMEMENKRMQMILLAQQKTVDMISRAFASAAAYSSSPPSSSEKKFQMGNN